MSYRPEIDGLRALAVLPVILFHSGFGLFSGGFVGVDVFFVISGYLITGIIYRDIVGGTFSIIQFYERRIRRILPALFLVCIVTVPFAWAWMLPEELESFSQSLVAVNLYASNVLFWRETGYFAGASELKPLLHTWSLAVEEQFYVLFPLLLLLLRKIERKLFMIGLFCAVILSLLLSEWMSRTHPAASFYLLPTRAWELGVGSLLSVALPRHNSSALQQQVLSFLGLLLILVPIFTYDASVPFPGIAALAPVLGTALIISYANGDTIVGAVLRWKPIVGLGLISYSAYLWHQPLFAFARIRSLVELGSSDLLILSGMSIALAYLSWRFVEQPFRNKNVFSRKMVFSLTAVFSASLVGIGLFTMLSDGFPRRLPVAARALIEQPTFATDSWKQCFANHRKYIDPNNACVSDSSLPRIAAVWGDSHAMALSDALASQLSKEAIALKYFTYAGCAPVLGYRRSDMTDDCPRFNSSVLDTLNAHEEIDVVFLLARWSLYIEGLPFDNTEGGVETGEPIYAIPVDNDEDFLADPTRIDRVGTAYRRTVEDLLASGKRVVLIYPVPEVGWRVPTHLAREIWFKVSRTGPLSTSFDVFKVRTESTRRQLDILPEHPNLIRIRPEEIFCDTYLSHRCIAQLNSAPLYFDDDHLNAEGSSMLSEKIIDAMRGKGWLSPRR